MKFTILMIFHCACLNLTVLVDINMLICSNIDGLYVFSLRKWHEMAITLKRPPMSRQTDSVQW